MELLLHVLPKMVGYYDDLIETRPCKGFEVKQGVTFGKGVYSKLDFQEDELVLKDEMLFGAQHTSNKVDCFVCSHCFQFIGSVELQIGRKLYLQGLGLSSKEDVPTESDDEDCYPMENHNHSELCSSSASRDNSAPSDDTLESLMNGTLSLPYSEKFSLPPVISCLGGCEEEHYCSKSCAEADWELFHSILCTGKNSRSLQRNALAKFVEHANKTNDIFILAAKAISFTILRYKKLKITHLKNQIQNTGLHEVARTNFSLLMEAWRPISMGFKKRWWDCIALPDDIDSSREASFRMQIKELAFELQAPRRHCCDVLPSSSNTTMDIGIRKCFF
ncbi:Histone-lysine N-methyltransferase ATXR2 [Acorus calamus]|uniref:Histone-lysine N-methyltransferase ATXR2 n=1 Tax=Acorus calamus TaxID=4465 RepID=A0AAV9FH10_ACOCL|nr:Histone-lysine N-methyltransferase ATXR2 [Acorus calamus]